MSFTEEGHSLAKKFSDRSRKVVRVGRIFNVHHKVKLSGSTITPGNFVPKIDVSHLDLEELRFLDVFREMGWDFDKTCEKLGLETIKARKTYQKCLWFKQEDVYVQAKAKVPTPEYILAKDFDNVEGVSGIDDSQHKSLDRLAKITGAFKSGEVNIQQNIFNLPDLPPEALAKVKVLADQEAQIIQESLVQEAQVVHG